MDFLWSVPRPREVDQRSSVHDSQHIRRFLHMQLIEAPTWLPWWHHSPNLEGGCFAIGFNYIECKWRVFVQERQQKHKSVVFHALLKECWLDPVEGIKTKIGNNMTYLNWGLPMDKTQSQGGKIVLVSIGLNLPGHRSYCSLALFCFNKRSGDKIKKSVWCKTKRRRIFGTPQNSPLLQYWQRKPLLSSASSYDLFRTETYYSTGSRVEEPEVITGGIDAEVPQILCILLG